MSTAQTRIAQFLAEAKADIDRSVYCVLCSDQETQDEAIHWFYHAIASIETAKTMFNIMIGGECDSNS